MSEKIKYCPNCGEKIESVSSNYCSNCGKQLTGLGEGSISDRTETSKKVIKG